MLLMTPPMYNVLLVVDSTLTPLLKLMWYNGIE